MTLRRYLLIILLLPMAGCGQKLDYETTLLVGDGEVQTLSIDPPKRAQKVSVTATSSGSPVSVYVVLEKDKESAKQALLDGKKPAQALIGTAKTKDATLEANVPAQTAAVVLVGGARKSSEVKVKISGR
jgi:hypothetical protein